jgi:hypothetical protein
VSDSEYAGPSGSVLAELLAEAHRIKNERCAAFPHLICNETQGLAFDDWCDPCKARHIVEWEKAQNAEHDTRQQQNNQKGQTP